MRGKISLLLCFMTSYCLAQNTLTYQLDKKIDYSIIGVSTALTAADLILLKNTSPLSKEEINGLDKNDIWSIDRSAVDQTSNAAKDMSDVFEKGVFLLPAAFIFSDKAKAEYKTIAVMYAETFTLNLLTTHFVKYTLKRTRPFIYNPDIDIDLKQSKSARASLYSGHTSHTAALSIFTAKVFSDLYPDSRWKPVVWTTAVSIPIVTGFLRYKAGQHYPTDVAAGFIAGSLIGYLVPELHKLKSVDGHHLKLSTSMSSMTLRYQF